MNRLKYLILWCLISTPFIQAKVLIWDIGDVLLETSRFGMGRSVGLSHFISYMLFDWKSPRIEPILFDVLDTMDCPELPDSIQAFTKDGIPMPPIMCHWQAGTISGKEIVAQAEKHLDTLFDAGYFVSCREMRLIDKTIRSMFDPRTLATNMSPLWSGIRLLKECAHEYNEDGTPRNILIALSNWDPSSFKIVKELHPDIFDHFDHIVISGDTGRIKPRKAAYEHLIKTFKLTPSACLVIDDQAVNLDAAQELGFETFHVYKRNYRTLRQCLYSCNALS